MQFDDLNIDRERLQLYLLFIGGVLLGYLCVLAAIELELYYYQSRFVVAKLYDMITDAEKASSFRDQTLRRTPDAEQASQFREASQGGTLDPTSLQQREPQVSSVPEAQSH
jgi:hypothetical protein